MRWLFDLIEPLVIFAILFLLMLGLGFVSITYDNVIENDPLMAPVGVTSVDGDRIVLADGRTLVASFNSEFLADEIEECGSRVDLDSQGDGTFAVSVAYRRWKCGHGGPWLRLRWIPVEFPLYRRAELGTAQIVDQP